MSSPSSKPVSARGRFLRLTLITMGVVAFAVIGLHLWFANNARGVLRDIVHTESGGKLKLDLSELEFGFFENKIKIREADLISTDSLTAATSYRVKFRKLTLRVNSFWPLLLERKLLLDSIKLHDPEVTVVQWRRDTTVRFERDELSIPQQMGKLYNSMLDALDDFGIRRIIINNAKLSLENKIRPGIEPVTISNVYFSLIRTADGPRKRDTFIAKEQTVDLTTTNQNIALPGGRHRLAFKTFSLELFRKRIVLDSCTLWARSTTSSKSNYTIFFNKLLLVGVDFDALYRFNLIKADSVYCENPLFNINLNTASADPNAKKKERPDPEKIIRELTGDLDLAYIGVKDAGIHINISGTKDRSLFNSNKDDFEMRGLRIHGDSAKPVVVRQFDMLVRDYHLYNEDSSAAYTFDSIHFANNKIALNNFTMKTGMTRVASGAKDFRIPYFELTGLNWFELIFNQNVVAREALLHNPVINLRTGSSAKKAKKTSFFSSLHTLDDLLTLEKLTVVNGQVAMQLGSATNLTLQNLNVGLNSNALLRSNNKDGLRRAVENLSFSNGTIRLKGMTATLSGVRYSGASLLLADKVRVTTKNGAVNALIQQVAMDNLLLDDETERVEMNGLHWKAATITVKGGAKGKASGSAGDILLRNISGSNTAFRFVKGKMEAITFLRSIRLASLSKRGAAAPLLEGLTLAGNRLSVGSPSLQVKATDYILGDGDSYLANLTVQQVKGQDSVKLQTPRLSFATDINGLLREDIHFRYAHLSQPQITIRKHNQKSTEADKDETPIHIDRLTLTQPQLQATLYRNDSISRFILPQKQDSDLTIAGLSLTSAGTAIDRLTLVASGATFTKSSGEVMGIENGKVDIDLSDLRFAKRDSVSTWSVLVNRVLLQNPNNFLLGKKGKGLKLDQLSLGNLRLSSGYLSNIDDLIKANASAWLRTATGQYVDSNTTLKWHNASYDVRSKSLSLDSFRYHPTRSLDSVLAQTPFQTDYITLHTGAIKLSDFNLEKYKSDTAIYANTLSINNPFITIYRDKNPPLPPAVIKPLLTDMIKRIGIPVGIQRVVLADGQLTYTEKNAKTGMEGTLLLARLNGGLSNIKNRDFKETDSLQFTINAYLMDSAELALRVRQSYTDTLNGFLMTLRMKPTTLSFLNPVLAPLSNVILKSGTIDSLQIRAIGKEDLALGEMKMYYHDLKIKLVKDGNAEETSLLRRAASFLANTLIIKKNNNGRTGLIYYERDKSRSFFNYIIRMTFSGMATSIGVKKNRKYMKAYKQALQDRHLPPIELE